MHFSPKSFYKQDLDSISTTKNFRIISNCSKYTEIILLKSHSYCSTQQWTSKPNKCSSHSIIAIQTLNQHINEISSLTQTKPLHYSTYISQEDVKSMFITTLTTNTLKYSHTKPLQCTCKYNKPNYSNNNNKIFHYR